MPRPPDDQRRADLLNGLIDAYADGGIGGRSLREVAEVVGTSHRMLLHYFGSRDELLVSGTVGEVGAKIAQLRAEARTRHGWIMDTYLLRSE